MNRHPRTPLSANALIGAAALLCSVFPPSTSNADNPTSEGPARTDVFVAGQDGVHTYRIPAMIVSPSGALLVFCEARKQGIGDASPTDMVLKRSLDGGRTWLPMQTLVRGEGTDAIMNPCAVLDRTSGTVFLFCCNTNRAQRGEHRRHLLLASRDDGRTWSPPTEIGSQTAEYNDTFVSGPGVGIQTTAGRLVIPGYTSHDPDFRNEKGLRSRVLFSDDHGQSWHMSQPVSADTNESQVVELVDGRLMLNMRQGTGQSCRAVAISKDGGESWEDVSWDRTLNECPCQASFLRYSRADVDGKSRILFANPDNAGAQYGVERTKMTVRISYDEGQTWPVKKLIHAGPSSYSSLVRLPDGDVGLVFEGGEKHRREWIRFTRLPLAWLTDGADSPDRPQTVSFEVQADVAHRHLASDFCWFHPRVAALPGFGKDGQPAVIMTIQKHLVVSDYYSGMYFLRTDDLGKTWTGPTEIPELAWRQGPNNETIAVCDVTPGWHAPTGKLIAVGVKLRYSPQGGQLLDQPRSHECAYATFDPQTNRWTTWKMLAMPDTDGKFFLVAPGCVQWLVQPDGTLLVPIYFKGPTGSDYQSRVLHCTFDGQEMKYVTHGDELALQGGRGLCEPSLAFFGGKYYLTLRNDARGYVTTSRDGLHFEPIKAWTFDDGQDLGSYNTQTHWLVHSDGLFLTYTRRGANNDHIARNRAPIFIAQVDPARLQVIRKTEKALLPERGVMLGNFGAAAITPHESWVTDAEFVFGTQPHPRGADGTVWLGRVKWSRPNRLVK